MAKTFKQYLHMFTGTSKINRPATSQRCNIGVGVFIYNRLWILQIKKSTKIRLCLQHGAKTYFWFTQTIIIWNRKCNKGTGNSWYLVAIDTFCRNFTWQQNKTKKKSKIKRIFYFSSKKTPWGYFCFILTFILFKIDNRNM